MKGLNMNTEKTIVYKTKALTGRIIILIFLILISSLILGVGFGYSLSQIVAREVTFVYVFLSLAVILAITQALINVFSFQLTRQYRMFLEDKTIEHILSLKHSTTLNVGETVGIVRLTTEEVSNEITSIIKGVFTILFTVIFSAIYAFLINPVVLLICVLFVVIVAFFNRKLTKKLPEMHDDLNLSVNSLMAVQWEFIKNREVGAWLNPAHVVSGYNNLTEFASKKLIKANKYEVLATLFSNYGSIIVVLIVAVIGGLLSERGLISAPELFALIILIPVIAGSLFNIPDQLNGFQRLKGGIATLDRLFSLEKHDIDC
jgi:ABC-type multidrug transport system fused ATPase/permease subunit